MISLPFIRRRRRLARPQPISGQNRNPYFPGTGEQGRAAWRYRAYLIEVGLAFFLIAYILFFSRLFNLVNVTAFTNDLPDAQLQAAVTDIFRTSRMLKIFSSQNYLTLRPDWLSNKIAQAYRETKTFERIQVTKVFPNTVQIKVSEQGVAYLWRIGNELYGLNNAGALIQHFQPDQTAPALITFSDQNALPQNLGSSRIVNQAVLAAGAAMHEALGQLQLTEKTIDIPIVSCAQPVLIEPAALSNANGNINSNQTNSSVNRGVLNANVTPAQPDCDLDALVYDNRELHAVLENGTEILFVTDSIDSQIEKLRRVIQDAKIDLTSLSYVDIRFGERVYYK